MRGGRPFSYSAVASRGSSSSRGGHQQPQEQQQRSSRRQQQQQQPLSPSASWVPVPSSGGEASPLAPPGDHHHPRPRLEVSPPPEPPPKHAPPSSCKKAVGACASSVPPSLPPPPVFDPPDIEAHECPIGMSVMVEPTITADGHSYDRANIERWIVTKGKKTSPNTGLPLADLCLIPNHALKSSIAEYARVQSVMREQLRQVLAAASAQAMAAATSSPSSLALEEEVTALKEKLSKLLREKQSETSALTKQKNERVKAVQKLSCEVAGLNVELARRQTGWEGERAALLRRKEEEERRLNVCIEELQQEHVKKDRVLTSWEEEVRRVRGELEAARKEAKTAVERHRQAIRVEFSRKLEKGLWECAEKAAVVERELHAQISALEEASRGRKAEHDREVGELKGQRDGAEESLREVEAGLREREKVVSDLRQELQTALTFHQSELSDLRNAYRKELSEWTTKCAALNEKVEEEVKQKMTVQHEEKVRELKASHAQDMAKVRGEEASRQEAVVADLREKLKSAVASHEAEANNLHRTYQEELQDASDRYGLEMRKQAQHHDKLVADLQEKLKGKAAEVASLHVTHQEEMQGFVDRYGPDMQRQRQEHDQVVAALQEKVRSVVISHETEVADLHSSHQAELQEVGERYALEVRRQGHQHDKVVMDLQEKLKNMATIHATEVVNLHNTYQGELQEVTDQYQLVKACLDGHKQKEADMSAQHEAAITRMKKDTAAIFKRQEEEKEREVAELTGRVQTKEQEVTLLQHKLARATEEVGRVKKEQVEDRKAHRQEVDDLVDLNKELLYRTGEVGRSLRDTELEKAAMQREHEKRVAAMETEGRRKLAVKEKEVEAVRKELADTVKAKEAEVKELKYRMLQAAAHDASKGAMAVVGAVVLAGHDGQATPPASQMQVSEEADDDGERQWVERRELEVALERERRRRVVQVDDCQATWLARQEELGELRTNKEGQPRGTPVSQAAIKRASKDVNRAFAEKVVQEKVLREVVSLLKSIRKELEDAAITVDTVDQGLVAATSKPSVAPTPPPPPQSNSMLLLTALSLLTTNISLSPHHPLAVGAGLKVGEEGGDRGADACAALVGLLWLKLCDEPMVVAIFSAMLRLTGKTATYAGNTIIIRRLGEAGACEAITHVMQFHQGHDTIAGAVILVGCLAMDAGNRDRLGNTMACEMIMEAMRLAEEGGDREMQLQACWAVHKLGLGHPPNQVRLGQRGACERIVSCLVSYPQDRAIQVVAGKVVRLLSSMDPSRFQADPRCARALREAMGQKAWAGDAEVGDVMTRALQAIQVAGGEEEEEMDL